ncbi:MAG: hypothetical protein R3F17_02140 [Planctomycetota bacterium]
MGSIFFKEVDLGSTAFVGIEVHGPVKFEGVSVRNGLVFSQEDWTSFNRRHGLDDHDLQCAGEVSRCQLASSLDLLQCHVQGNLDLRLLSVRDLLVRQCQVEGNLRLDGQGEVASRVHSMSIDQCRVDQELRLSGLQASQRPELRRCEVRQGVVVDQESFPSAAPGFVFDECQMQSLRIDLGCRDDAIQGGQVGSLQYRLCGAKFFSLNGTRVEHWRFLEGSTEEGDRKPGVQLLERMKDADRAIYAAMERAQRRAGDERQADDIYRTYRWSSLFPDWRTQSRGRRRLRLIGAWLCVLVFPVSFWRSRWRALASGAATGFFTASHRVLLIAAVVGLPPTVAACLVRGNFCPSSLQLAEVQRLLPLSAEPTAAEWTATEATQAIANLFVPIVTFVTHPRWELTGERDLQLAIPWRVHPASDQTGIPQFETVTVHGLSAGMFGILVRTMFWVAWPMLLIGLASDLQRRRSQAG